MSCANPWRSRRHETPRSPAASRETRLRISAGGKRPHNLRESASPEIVGYSASSRGHRSSRVKNLQRLGCAETVTLRGIIASLETAAFSEASRSGDFQSPSFFVGDYKSPLLDGQSVLNPAAQIAGELADFAAGVEDGCAIDSRRWSESPEAWSRMLPAFDQSSENMATWTSGSLLIGSGFSSDLTGNSRPRCANTPFMVSAMEPAFPRASG
jgi:hypothetical protein